jgi:hypothetical protein
VESELERLQVKNWEQFQHYKDRAPPWIKLHKTLLDDREFHRLPDASRALAPCIWLLASESKDGSIAHDPETIAFRLRRSVKEIESAIRPLVSAGFLVVLRDASLPLAESEQGASKVLALARSREESREEAETDSCASRFERFWTSYPRKKAKGDAERRWRKINPNEQLAARIMAAVERATTSADWVKDEGQFIPYPATWLHDKGWEDGFEADAAVRRFAAPG